MAFDDPHVLFFTLRILLANKITAEAMGYVFPEEITKRLQLLGLVLS